MYPLRNLFVSNQSSGVKQLRRALAASALSLLFSCGCLVGTTLAWFQHSVSAPYTLEIGNFSVGGYMSHGVTGERTQLTSSACVLPMGAYTLTVQAGGNSYGYCVVSLTSQESGTAREVYCTAQLRSGETQRFTIHLNESTALSIRSVWGKLAEGAPVLETDRVLIYGRPPVVPEQKTEDSPAESAPTETTLTEVAPAENAPEETSPEESTPVETAPAENVLVETISQ